MPPPPPPPELMEELVEEILVRFPPDDPASLVRAALVCKRWCCLVSGTAFRRRFHEFHRHPPLLGVLYASTTDGDCYHSHKQQQQQQLVRDDDDDDDRSIIERRKRARILRSPPPTACFIPTTSFCPPGPSHSANNSRRRYHYHGWRAVDARHGRVLLRRRDPCLTYGRGLSVWDPITDEHHDLPDPAFNKVLVGRHWTAAVLATAATTCDHLDCHGGPFLVVVMDAQDHVIFRAVYSSESGAWSDLDYVHRLERKCSPRVSRQTPSVLVGTALYFLTHFDEIVEYDLATQAISTIDLPPEFNRVLEKRGVVLVTDDDGGLGFVAKAATNTTEESYHQLELWSMVDGGEGGFVKTSVVVDLQKLLPPAASSSCGGGAALNSLLRVNGFGFADAPASRFLFMRTSDGLYSIEINSSHVSKVANCCGDDDKDNVFVPYMSFCTPNSLIPGIIGVHN